MSFTARKTLSLRNIFWNDSGLLVSVTELSADINALVNHSKATQGNSSRYVLEREREKERAGRRQEKEED